MSRKRVNDYSKNIEPEFKKEPEDFFEIEPEKIEEPKKSFKVKVTHPSLRKRKAPNLSGEVVDLITDQGIYEIFDENNGWGQLEDGNWIMLSYTEIV